MPKTLLINQSLIKSLMTIEDYIQAMEYVHLQHGRGEVIAPGIIHADAADGQYNIKTGGILGDASYFGLKANGGFFQNKSKYQLPNILGIIYLSNAENGFPLAIFDSVEISKNRTAAASAVAANQLARKDAQTLCICGLGTQGEVQAEAISKVRNLKTIYAYGRNSERIKSYCETVSNKLNVNVVPAPNLEQALSLSDIVVTCTPSREAFIEKEWIKPGTFIAAVGADSPGKHELSSELVAASKVVPDILAQCINVGELQHPLQRNLMKEDDIHGELGKVLTGDLVGREDENEVIIYDSTGTALQDVAAAVLIYEKLLSVENSSASFDFFS